LIGAGYFILMLAMWNFASFDLGTNYGHFAMARAIQGLGIAPLFVPVSQLAYSFLPKNKNNKASSLTNLFRNQGGSFGIAFVTTMLSRRTQFHQTVIAEHANPVFPAYRAKFSSIAHYFQAHGLSPTDAAIHAKALIAQQVGQQAAFFAFMDCFRLLAFVAAVGVPLIVFIKPFDGKAPAASEAAH
jgi:DHA2 family multidrug resistance protein